MWLNNQFSEETVTASETEAWSLQADKEEGKVSSKLDHVNTAESLQA